MIITRRSLPRRTFLRGMGVTIALPLLDAMVPALSTGPAAGPVRRLGIVYAPNGMAMDSWTPRNAGADFELTPILQPLAPFRDRLVVVSGLDGQRNASAQSSHAAASTRFLTGVPGRQTAEGMEAGPSIDQLVARRIGGETPLASLELAVDPRDISGFCDGASCAFLNTVSWSSSTTALPTEHDPRVVFERMFGESGSTDAAARLASLRRQRSILDSVSGAVSTLVRGLGPGDRLKIDEYLDAVREIERRMQTAERRDAAAVPVVSQPAGIPDDFEEKVRLLFDLQVLAYQADVTRVITFMIGREFSGRPYPQIGVAEAHHPLSHHQNDPEKIGLLAKINTYHVSLFASYLEKLHARWRRLAAGSHAAAVRLWHQRRQQARSGRSAAPARRWGGQGRAPSAAEPRAGGQPPAVRDREDGRTGRDAGQQRPAAPARHDRRAVGRTRCHGSRRTRRSLRWRMPSARPGRFSSWSWG
ncbi:MAG: DUF1552 domain-containing protein [Acidobacteriota bacterium]